MNYCINVKNKELNMKKMKKIKSLRFDMRIFIAFGGWENNF